MKRIFLGLIILSFCLSNGFVKAQDLVILHTNDTHSQIEPQSTGSEKGIGGYERREVYVNKVRKENKNVLLIDAGDFDQGTPYFTLFNGDAEIELMNAMGYEAAAIGNHEFDNGVAELARRAKNAKFPLLCANYNFAGTPLEDVVKPYTIINKGKYKIGIIGVLADITTLVNKKNMGGVTYMQPYKVVDSLANDLKLNKGCDLVILLSHLGFAGGSYKNPSDKLIAANTAGIDIIVGGHSHTYIEQEERVKNKDGKDVVIVTAEAHGDFVGKLNVTFNGKKIKRNKKR